MSTRNCIQFHSLITNYINTQITTVSVLSSELESPIPSPASKPAPEPKEGGTHSLRVSPNSDDLRKSLAPSNLWWGCSPTPFHSTYTPYYTRVTSAPPALSPARLSRYRYLYSRRSPLSPSLWAARPAVYLIAIVIEEYTLLSTFV